LNRYQPKSNSGNNFYRSTFTGIHSVISRIKRTKGQTDGWKDTNINIMRAKQFDIQNDDVLQNHLTAVFNHKTIFQACTH